VRGGERFFTNWRIGLILIFVASVVLYVPSLWGTPVWDDKGILSGMSIGGGTVEGAFTRPFNVAYFRPLTSLSYLLDWKLYYEHPFFYHQTNILIHAATAVLVAWLGLLLFKSRRVGLLAGLLFAVQPAQCSAVSWIGARTDLLGALFGTLFAAGLFMYLESNRARWLVLSSVAFFLGMLAKEQLAGFILLPLLASLLVIRRPFRTVATMGLAYLIPLAVFATMWVAFYPDPYRLGSAGVAEQLRRFGATGLHYFQLLIFPTPIGMHALSLSNYKSSASIAAGFAILAVLSGLLLWAARKNSAAAFAGLFFVLAYGPISNVIPIPSLLVGPYRATVAGVGVAVLLAWALLQIKPKIPNLGPAIGVAYAAVCAGFCWWGIQSWSDELTFFKTVARYDPNGLVNRINYANLLAEMGDGKGSVREMEVGLDYAYASPNWRDMKTAVEKADDPGVVSRVEWNQGTKTDAAETLAHMLAIRAFGLDMAKQPAEALETAKAAVVLHPQSPDTQAFIGQLMEDRAPGSGLEKLRLATRIGSKLYSTWAALGIQRLRFKDYAEAEKCFEKAFALMPDQGQYATSLAEARLGLGNAKGALEALHKARHGIYSPDDVDRLEKKANQMLGK